MSQLEQTHTSQRKQLSPAEIVGGITINPRITELVRDALKGGPCSSSHVTKDGCPSIVRLGAEEAKHMRAGGSEGAKHMRANGSTVENKHMRANGSEGAKHMRADGSKVENKRMGAGSIDESKRRRAASSSEDGKRMRADE